MYKIKIITRPCETAEKPGWFLMAQLLCTQEADIIGILKAVAYWYFSPPQQFAMRWVTFVIMSFLMLPPI